MNTCLKYIFVIINIFFMIIGALCIGFVFWTRAIKLIDDTLVNLELSDFLFYFGICLGGFLVLLGLCGAMGACSGRKTLLGIYLGIIVFFVLCEVGALIYSILIGRPKIVEKLESIWNSTLSDEVKNGVQRTFKCCGYTSSTEWPIPPESCYSNTTSVGGTNTNSTSENLNNRNSTSNNLLNNGNSTSENLTDDGLWKTSCSEKVLDWFKENILVFGGALAATLLFQMFQIIVTALLIRAIIVPNQVQNQQGNADKKTCQPSAPPRDKPVASYSNASFVQEPFYDNSRGRGIQIKKQQPTKVNNSNW